METAALSSGVKTSSDSPEESSWTYYIEGFTCGNESKFDQSSYASSDYYESPSLVSDASSPSVFKMLTYNIGFSSEKYDKNRTIFSNQSSFKKQKTRDVIDVGNDLEDTASSHVENSPKLRLNESLEKLS